jgi:hypothetical protein
VLHLYESWEKTKVMGPTGTKTKGNCAGEGQQQSTWPHQARPEVSSISIDGREKLKNRVFRDFIQCYAFIFQWNFVFYKRNGIIYSDKQL